jgi:hypothetical protein
MNFSKELSTIKALTLPYNQISDVIACSVNLSFPESLLSEGQNQIKDVCIAIWDTGAMASAVTELEALKLGLIQTGVKEISGLGGTLEKKTYLMDILLPNDIVLKNHPVTEIDNPKDKEGNKLETFGMLIGMDIISMGDFAVTNFEGKTVMSFRVPSMHKICYVAEYQKMANIQAKTQRNQPQPPNHRRK